MNKLRVDGKPTADGDDLALGNGELTDGASSGRCAPRLAKTSVAVLRIAFGDGQERRAEFLVDGDVFPTDRFGNSERS